MTLGAFDILGEDVTDERTETLLKAGDPRRSLVRYRPDGAESFVSSRINLLLWRAASELPILLLKPSSRADEVLKPSNPALEAKGGWDLLTPEGSRRNWVLLERLCQDLAQASFPACYLAEQHGSNRRDFYFVTEDAEGLERIARAAADGMSFPLGVERYRLADVAPIILPAEAIGELGLILSASDRVRPTRFEFWGAETSLNRLRDRLERRGYKYIGYDPGVGELRVLKSVPFDGPGFLEIIQEIAPLARSLGCSYRGSETIEGADQFAPGTPLPARYVRKGAASTLARLFGRKTP